MPAGASGGISTIRWQCGRIQSTWQCQGTLLGWTSVTEGDDSVETKTLSNRSEPKRLRNKKLGPAWVLSPEDRSNIETKIPNHVEIESIEPRPTLKCLNMLARNMQPRATHVCGWPASLTAVTAKVRARVGTSRPLPSPRSMVHKRQGGSPGRLNVWTCLLIVFLGAAFSNFPRMSAIFLYLPCVP